MVAQDPGSEFDFKMRKKKWFIGWVPKQAISWQPPEVSPSIVPKTKKKEKVSIAPLSAKTSAPISPLGSSAEGAKNTNSSQLSITVLPSFVVQDFLLRSENNIPFFDYTIGGFSGGVEARLKLFSFGKDIQAFLSASYHLARLSGSLSLKNSENLSFVTLDQAQLLHQVSTEISLLFPLNAKKDMQIGPVVGGFWNQLSEDDAYLLNGTNLGVFIGETALGVSPGILLQLLSTVYEIEWGVKYLKAFRHEESPVGISGTDPSYDWGLDSHLRFGFNLFPSHQVGLGYRLYYQKASFSGAVNRANRNLINAESETLRHQISLFYRWLL